MIPATSDPEGTRVVITGFPAVQQTAAQQIVPRREPADAADATSLGQRDATDAAKNRAAAPNSLIDLICSLQDENGWLRLEDLRDLPREVWLAASSVCVGLLAGLLWLSGSRKPAPPHRRESIRRRGGHPQIDWSGIETGRDDEFDGTGFNGAAFDGASAAGHDDRNERHAPSSRAAA